jgi:hypothetical protein
MFRSLRGVAVCWTVYVLKWIVYKCVQTIIWNNITTCQHTRGWFHLRSEREVTDNKFLLTFVEETELLSKTHGLRSLREKCKPEKQQEIKTASAGSFRLHVQHRYKKSMKYVQILAVVTICTCKSQGCCLSQIISNLHSEYQRSSWRVCSLQNRKS